ncbi:MAG: carbohydrate ABC transporter permease [Nitrososphaerota archaeon]
MSPKKFISNLFLSLSTILLLVYTLLPIYWLFITSFKIPIEYWTKTPTLFPSKFTLEHYYEIFKKGFLLNISNTVFVCVSASLIAIIVGLPASYSLSRLKIANILKNGMLTWILISRIIPPVVIVLPLYTTFKIFGLTNNLLGLSIAYEIYVLPFTIWALIGFFKNIPKEVEEAALVDGASRITILIRIFTPIILPGIVAILIMGILTIWNEFLFAYVFLSESSKLTLPVVIAGLVTSEYGEMWGQLAAAGLISSIPMLLFTGYLQKYLVLGFATREIGKI